MESKTILFTVDGDSISPKTEQKAGVQGNHNITKVRFNVEETLVSGALGDSPTSRIRMQFINGAGGFYSTGFLDVMSEILPDESAQYYVTCPIPNNVTNAGGVAYVYLVVTEIEYEGKKALEKQAYISPPGKLFYTHSGVGSPSDCAYRVGISNALVNAEIFVGQAERASEAAESAKKEAQYASTVAAERANNTLMFFENAKDSANEAAQSEQNAKTSADSAKSAQEAAESSADEAKESADATAECLNEIENKLANGEFKGEKGDTGAQGEKGDKGEKGDQGEQGIQGVSGVYLGSGEMPEGYNVQIDPDGESIEVCTKKDLEQKLDKPTDTATFERIPVVNRGNMQPEYVRIASGALENIIPRRDVNGNIKSMSVDFINKDTTGDVYASVNKVKQMLGALPEVDVGGIQIIDIPKSTSVNIDIAGLFMTLGEYMAITYNDTTITPSMGLFAIGKTSSDKSKTRLCGFARTGSLSMEVIDTTISEAAKVRIINTSSSVGQRLILISLKDLNEVSV